MDSPIPFQTQYSKTQAQKTRVIRVLFTSRDQIVHCVRLSHPVNTGYLSVVPALQHDFWVGNCTTIWVGGQKAAVESVVLGRNGVIWTKGSMYPDTTWKVTHVLEH